MKLLRLCRPSTPLPVSLSKLTFEGEVSSLRHSMTVASIVLLLLTATGWNSSSEPKGLGNSYSRHIFSQPKRQMKTSALEVAIARRVGHWGDWSANAPLEVVVASICKQTTRGGRWRTVVMEEDGKRASQSRRSISTHGHAGISVGLASVAVCAAAHLVSFCVGEVPATVGSPVAAAEATWLEEAATPGRESGVGELSKEEVLGSRLKSRQTVVTIKL